MLTRILSVLLCAALLLGGTALAAKEDDYTLPELLYQQFAVQDYTIRGSVAVTASGAAPWLGFLLPLTASTLHVRLLNLEDSAAPRCFEIEQKRKERCDIPIFHDDQHGTAVITLAGLTTALKVVGKKKEDVRIVTSGAGAATFAIVKLLLSASSWLAMK